MKCAVPGCENESDVILEGTTLCKYHSEEQGLEEAQDKFMDAILLLSDLPEEES